MSILTHGLGAELSHHGYVLPWSGNVHSRQLLKSRLTSLVDSATTAMTHGLHLPCLKKPLCGPRCFHLTPGNDFHLLAMSLQALKAVFQSRIPGVPHSWTFWLAPSSSHHIAGSLLSKSAFSEGNCGCLSKMPLSLPLSCDCRKGWIFLLAWTQPSLPPSLRTAMHDGRGWSLWNTMYLT